MAGNGANSIRIMGIDPGLNITGYGIIERRRQGTALVEAGVIRLPRAEGNNLPLRLETLFKGIQEVVDEFRPEVVCLEEIYSHADYPQTAVLMGHARGVICLAGATGSRSSVSHVGQADQAIDHGQRKTPQSSRCNGPCSSTSHWGRRRVRRTWPMRWPWRYAI